MGPVLKMQKKGGDVSCRSAGSCRKARRSSPLAWKIIGVGTAALVALSWNRSGQDVEIPGQGKILQSLKTLQLKAQLDSWFELMRETPVARLVGKTGYGEKGGIRMFENCIADTVTVDDNVLQLSEVVGHAKVEFDENTFCGNALGVITIEGEWVEGGPDGSTVFTYSDGRYAEAVFRKGVVWGIVKTFRCLLSLQCLGRR